MRGELPEIRLTGLTSRVTRLKYYRIINRRKCQLKPSVQNEGMRQTERNWKRYKKKKKRQRWKQTPVTTKSAWNLLASQGRDNVRDIFTSENSLANKSHDIVRHIDLSAGRFRQPVSIILFLSSARVARNIAIRISLRRSLSSTFRRFPVSSECIQSVLEIRNFFGNHL